MAFRKYLIASMALLIVGCGADKPVESDEATKKLMLDVLDPAVDEIWDRQGWVSTDEGEASLFPKNDEEWAAVTAGAAKVKEIALLLASPDYAKGRKDWAEYAMALAETADMTSEAVDARNEEDLFDAGGAIYQVCTRCHSQYVVPKDE